ncbi:MAG: hypothetical protein AAB368_03080, partial [bacterium]
MSGPRPVGNPARQVAGRDAAAAWVLLGALLAAAFLPVVAGRGTLLPIQPGVLPDGPWDYPGPRPRAAVFDPAASALSDLPLTALASRAWRAGALPFWNPFAG